MILPPFDPSSPETMRMWAGIVDEKLSEIYGQQGKFVSRNKMVGVAAVADDEIPILDQFTTGFVPTSRKINTGAELTGGGDLHADRTISHALSGVVANTYTNATITVNTYGHITNAVNGIGSDRLVSAVGSFSTLILTDDTFNQTLTGNLGNLNLLPGGDLNVSPGGGDLNLAANLVPTSDGVYDLGSRGAFNFRELSLADTQSSAGIEIIAEDLTVYNSAINSKSDATGISSVALTAALDANTVATGGYFLADSSLVTAGTTGTLIGLKATANDGGAKAALAYAGYFTAVSSGAGTARGGYFAASGGTSNYGVQVAAGDLYLSNNTNSFKLGSTGQSAIRYDGTNLILNPRASGSGALVLGAGATNVDYELRFDGETSDGSLFWMEDEGILNLRTQGAAYYDFGGTERSSFTIDTIYDSAQQSVTIGMACWIKGANGMTGFTPYGFFGGYYDEGASAPTGITVYAAAGYNYFTATNARTIASAVALQAFNDTSSANNLTITDCIGLDVSSPYGGSGAGGSATRVIGVRLGGSGGTTNWAARCSADVQMDTTNKFILGGNNTKGINWLVRGATTTNVILAINSANEYDFRAASAAPVSGGTAKTLGLATSQGWAGMYLQDASATQTVEMLANSSTALTANRTLTFDLVNASRTIKINPQTYTVTNVTTDRSYDANATTIDELADVLGTLIADLKDQGWTA